MKLNQIIEIDFEKCFLSLIKHFRVIILVTILAFSIGLGTAAFSVEPDNKYMATSSVYGIVYGSFNDSSNILNSLKAYGEIVKSYKIAERAALLIGDDTLDKNQIYDMISVDYDSSTLDYSAIIYIHATSTDRQTSIDVTNAVAQAFVLEIANLTGQDDIQILDTASTSSVTYNAQKEKIKTILIVTVLGFLAACACIFITTIFSNKMYSPKDATDHGQLEIIGVIPDFSIDESYNPFLMD
ncbi:MAG: hypothetical protein II653_01250 [Lachnospiraceae bacterium]|jgi:capsular polysaccharide biosynthesis protein|nr:hypothetical protein [Lachnospiraceae bacterium]MBQ5473744.1 hypothetical protein [Lachnospiraceae bacterium]